jgi:hypothetical protein
LLLERSGAAKNVFTSEKTWFLIAMSGNEAVVTALYSLLASVIR